MKFVTKSQRSVIKPSKLAAVSSHRVECRSARVDSSRKGCPPAVYGVPKLRS